MSSHPPRILKTVPKLYDRLSLQDIDIIQTHFRALKLGGLSYEKFRGLLGRFNIVYSDDAFHNVCLKIDTARDNVISWSEFIAYFILELQIDDNMKERLSIIPPIPRSANVLSSLLPQCVLRVLFMEDSSDVERSVYGNYVTIGSGGDLSFWSCPKWKLERTSHAVEVPETTSSTIELSDKRQIKKSLKTFVLEAAALVDMQIICMSSVCCDLRFYDVAAGKCNLRLYIRNFPAPLTAMHSHCSTDGDDKNFKLIFGDMLGSVRVIYFAKNFKSKFREGSTLRQISYQELMKGKYETIACNEFTKIHHDVVRQVSFVESLNSFISASESIVTKSAYLPSVIIGNLDIQDSQIIFKMNSGTTCFAFDETSQTLATGGPDSSLRLWNPITPSRPKAILSGHTSGVASIFMQDGGAKIYSMDKNKIIKIWDAAEEQLLQTFIGLKTIFSDDIPVTAFYNDLQREFVVASKRIATVKCQASVNLAKTDGFTHTSPVTVILLNELFQFLVTCSECSTIIIWDVWMGRKVNLIARAHTRVKHGEVKLDAITAGCFDPHHQFLLTAGDETLKVWNFNEGICLRTISIDGPHRVKDVFWMPQRIFAIGRTVTEFLDSNDYKEQINIGATWMDCHSGTIICASVRSPHAVVTSCTLGDLIFWHYETGRPYMRFNVKYPSHRLEDVYNKKVDVAANQNVPEAMKTKENNTSAEGDKESLASSSSKLPEIPLTSQRMLSLNSRPLSAKNGTLLVSLSSGRVQVWSHHHTVESCITDFNAVHVAGDVITAMASDTQNCYLFTGSARGYIKAWMIVNFCLSTSAVAEISPVKLRVLFPFLQKDVISGRAKQSVKNQLEPQLLNSYQGHKNSITGLIFSESNQVLISSSSDKSVRLWHLSGKYIGTIGSPINWRSVSPNEAPPCDFAFRFPADLRHAVSFTTLKVLEGGNVPALLTRNANELEMKDKELPEDAADTQSSDAMKPFARFLRKPSVKKDAQLEAQRRYEKPTLDISLPHIPVYGNLKIHPTVPINLPKTIPKCLETDNLPNLQYIYLEPDELKTE